VTVTHLRAPTGYALSGLRAGVRCRCHGHAWRCPSPQPRQRPGPPQCDCRHHTQGRDCQECRPFYRDRPWAPATATDAHECTACDCNLHSRRCRFNHELYQMSGQKSGGICVNCQHHTEGQHCQYCREGYTRNEKRPITHRKACIACQCHPVGALSLSCNRGTGQCQCKAGVRGKRCNQCAEGYQPSDFAATLCTEITKQSNITVNNTGNNTVCQCHPVGALSLSCNRGTGQCQCKAGVRGKRCNQCAEGYQPSDFAATLCTEITKQTNITVNNTGNNTVVQARIAAVEKAGDWWSWNVTVRAVYKQPGRLIRRGRHRLRAPARDAACGCPSLGLGRVYLLLGGPAGDSGHLGAALRVDRKGQALPWREAWAGRLRRLRRAQREGECGRDHPQGQHHTTEQPLEQTSLGTPTPSGTE
ncbi:netrin-1-like, partial [Cetorhinus maximus]